MFEVPTKNFYSKLHITWYIQKKIVLKFDQHLVSNKDMEAKTS